MKTYKASEMETCKAAWNGDTDWCSFRDGWMARASRPVEAALQERLNLADQRIDELENAKEQPKKEPNHKLILQCVLAHLEQLASGQFGTKKDMQSALQFEAGYIRDFVEPLKP